MINVLLNQIHQSSLLISIIVMFLLNASLSFFWPLILNKIKPLKSYDGIQRVHEGEVPRLGGLVSYLGLLIYWLLCQNCLHQRISFFHIF